MRSSLEDLLIRLCGLGLIVILLSACGSGDRPATDTSSSGATAAEETIPFRDDGRLTFLRNGDPVVDIAIEIAETDSARQRGLMQRSSLPDRSGMLFIFEREDLQSFWMSNTPVALDLIFVDSDSQIVDVDKYARPFSTEAIASDEPARFVVEVPAGFSDTHGIVEGERITWEKN